jgi:hypothetical protein
MQVTLDQAQYLLNTQVKLLDLLTRRRDFTVAILESLPKTEEDAMSSPLWDQLDFKAVRGLVGTFVEGFNSEIEDRTKAVEQIKLEVTQMSSQIVRPDSRPGSLFPLMTPPGRR